MEMPRLSWPPLALDRLRYDFTDDLHSVRYPSFSAPSSLGTPPDSPTSSVRASGNIQQEQSILARWPVEVPPNWAERLNQADDGRELKQPYAGAFNEERAHTEGLEWQKEIAKPARVGVGLSTGGAVREKVGTDHADTRD